MTGIVETLKLLLPKKEKVTKRKVNVPCTWTIKKEKVKRVCTMHMIEHRVLLQITPLDFTWGKFNLCIFNLSNDTHGI